MNREIKFRAWDGKKMLFSQNSDFYLMPNGIQVPSSTGHEFYDKNFPVMQFTGLHDKNGKEIYEGDIVKGYRPACKFLREKNWVGIIEFAKVRSAFVVRVKHLDGIDTFDNIISCDSDYQVDAETLTDHQYQIIGNIYEHENLLNGQ